MDRTPHQALAHPLRSRILLTLRKDGRATSAELARALGSNTGVVSYHLRQLHEVGLVLDAGRSGRRRWWIAGSDVAVAELIDSPAEDDDESGARWLARDYVLHHAEKNLAWIDEQELWPSSWRAVGGLHDHLLLLTAEQLDEVKSAVDEILTRARRLGAGNPSAKRVAFYTCALPIDAPGSHGA